jgi:hypothetical protein
MPYVERINGKITALYACLQPGRAEEFLADDHSEIVAYLNPPPPVPQSVSMAQARQALMDAGLFDAIDGGLNALPDGPTKRKALTFWEYSPTVSRNGELVTMLAAQFGLKDEQLDALFLAAAEIKG